MSTRQGERFGVFRKNLYSTAQDRDQRERRQTLDRTTNDTSSLNQTATTLLQLAQEWRHSPKDQKQTNRQLLQQCLVFLDEKLVNSFEEEQYPLPGVVRALLAISRIQQSDKALRLVANQPVSQSSESWAFGDKSSVFSSLMAISQRLWEFLENSSHETLFRSQRAHKLAQLLRTRTRYLSQFATKKTFPDNNSDNMGYDGFSDSRGDRFRKNSLVAAISLRLAQGDALGRLEVHEIVSTASFLLKILSADDAATLGDATTYLWRLCTAMLRRLRKKSIRQKMTNQQALLLLQTIVDAKWVKKAMQHDNISQYQEIKLAAYTIQKQSLLSMHCDQDSSGSTSTTSLFLLHWILIRQLQLPSDDPVVTAFGTNLMGIHFPRTHRLTDFAKLCDAYIESVPEALDRNMVLERLGNLMVSHIECTGEDTVKPWVISSITRYGAVWGDRQGQISRMASTLEELVASTPSFASRCQGSDIRDILWFWRSAHYRTKSPMILTRLAERALESDFQCTPKLTCRLLPLFTTAMAQEQQKLSLQADTTSLARSGSETSGIDKENQRLLSEVYLTLGEYLLSSATLTPKDVSSVLYAYAKASFIQDIGIFDHLVARMVEFTTPAYCGKDGKQPTARQVATSLWACGKMSGFEQQDSLDTGADFEELPYYQSASKLAENLAYRSTSLSTKDVAQSLWACGKLRICDDEVIIPLVNQARHSVPDMNTQEIANILLAMARVGCKDEKAIYVLTRPFAGPTSPSLPRNMPTTQEAANVLYALGRLETPDEEIFGNLSLVLLDNIETTSAQAVANVLWAHQSVCLQPPTRLLDQWTERKLGLHTS